MATIWQISCNGVSQPPAQWGIVLGKLTLVSQGIDLLTLDMEGDSVNNAPIFPMGATVDLLCNGVRKFSGRVTKTPSIGRPQVEKKQYVISGPWWYLENIVYQQPRTSLLSGSPVSINSVPTSRIVNFQSGTGHITNGAMILLYLAYAQTFNIPIATGTISPAVMPPWDECVDITVAAGLKRCLKWSPNCVTWFDYSQPKPVLHMVNRSALSTTTIDLVSSGKVTEFDVLRRDDILPVGLIINIENTVTLPDGSQSVQISTQTAGNSAAGVGVIVNTLTPNSSNSQTPEVISATLATDYWATINQLHHDGELRLQEQEISFAASVGQKLELTGGLAEWTSMDALIQRVDFEFQTGKTEVVFGAPAQLNSQDFLALLQQSVMSSGQTTFPTTGNPAQGAPGSPVNPPRPFAPNSPNVFPSLPTVDVEVCQDGSPVTLHLVGGT